MPDALASAQDRICHQSNDSEDRETRFVFRASVMWEFGAWHVGVHSLLADIWRPPGFCGRTGRLRALLHMSAGGHVGTWDDSL